MSVSSSPSTATAAAAVKFFQVVVKPVIVIVILDIVHRWRAQSSPGMVVIVYVVEAYAVHVPVRLIALVLNIVVLLVLAYISLESKFLLVLLQDIMWRAVDTLHVVLPPGQQVEGQVSGFLHSEGHNMNGLLHRHRQLFDLRGRIV